MAMIRNGEPMSLRQQLLLTAQLSTPAILAQLSTILMMYIDSAMVGQLGADDSAAIGLVSTSIWLFGGVCGAVATGFSVQVAHLLGAKRDADARNVFRQAIVACLLLTALVAIAGVAISHSLPHWLGGSEAIAPQAGRYFMILMLGIPLLEMEFLAGGMLRSSGNMKVPSLLNILMCVLDVAFNYLLIFPTRELSFAGTTFSMPGAGLGVEGAALGTMLAEGLVAVMMLGYAAFRSRELRLTQDSGSFRPQPATLKRAWHIAFPMGLQHTLMSGAAIVITAIVAPLGSVALAANAFAITAESVCYMPGYGIGDAATTLIGQSTGAGRRDLVRSFSIITVGSGMVIMALMGVLLYHGATFMMGVMSPVPEVVDLGARVLRIEAWAEPLFGAAIVCYGVMVGAGDTLAPCWMNLGSMWLVRLSLSALLVGSMGLIGVWLAMCIELCLRGTIFLVRLRLKYL